MGPQGARSFHALFAGSVAGVVFGLAGGAAAALALGMHPSVDAGAAGFWGAYVSILAFTPAATASLMGVKRRSHAVAGYAFSLACAAIVLVLGILYVPLVPWTPTLIACASVAGVRFAEQNEE